MWNRDEGLNFDEGTPPGRNVYGTHPFFMYKNSDKTWVGGFAKLAAAQDWYISNNPGTGIVRLYQAAVGGVGDYTFIIDSSPNSVSTAYLEIVGRPALIP